MGDPNDPLEGHAKYRALRALGRGGMGEVFEARHTGLGTRVVVKLLHADLADKPHLVDRMRLEAQVLARLKHPNIVRVTDFDATATGRPFFVMEYLRGRSVKEELQARGGALPVDEAVAIVREALAGLAAAHEAGIVHRDIKLDNLFLSEPSSGAGEVQTEQASRRRVKVLDFGVAKLVQATRDAPAPLAVPTATGVVVGTPRFFAPEQARGKPLDHRADLYAMGLVLYTLVAGRGPFDDASSVAEMARAHAFDTPVPPSKLARQPVAPKIDAVALRCLAKEPEERFASAAEMLAALDAASGPASAQEATTVAEPVAIEEVTRDLGAQPAARCEPPSRPPAGKTSLSAPAPSPVPSDVSPLAPTVALEEEHSQAGAPPRLPSVSPHPPGQDGTAGLEAVAPAPPRLPTPLVVAVVLAATAFGAALAAGVAMLL